MFYKVVVKNFAKFTGKRHRHVFFFFFYEIFKNIFFTEYLRAALPVY